MVPCPRLNLQKIIWLVCIIHKSILCFWTHQSHDSTEQYSMQSSRHWSTDNILARFLNSIFYLQGSVNKTSHPKDPTLTSSILCSFETWCFMIWTFQKIQNSFKYKEGFFIHTDCYHIHDRVSPCGNSNFDSQFITFDHSVAHCIQSCRIFELWNTENMEFFQSVRISKTNVNFKKDWPT